MVVPTLVAIVMQALPALDGGVPQIVVPAPHVQQPRSLLDPLPALKRTPPDEVYRLRDAKDGTGELVYEETGFTARIARDGSVQFKPKRVSEINLLPILPKRKGIHFGVPSLQSSLKAAAEGRSPPSPPPPPDDGSPPPETTTVIPSVSRYRPDPREGCRMCGQLPPLQLNVTWRFDVTEELMRINGEDPYRYQKAKFLVATRELRTRMAATTHAERIQQTVAELPSRLLSIGCDERLSLRDRRAILEALRAELDTGMKGGARGRRTDRHLHRHDIRTTGGVRGVQGPSRPVTRS
jgi:hypothetical protein